MRRMERYGVRVREMMAKKGGDGSWSWESYDLAYVMYGHGATEREVAAPSDDTDGEPYGDR